MKRADEIFDPELPTQEQLKAMHDWTTPSPKSNVDRAIDEVNELAQFADDEAEMWDIINIVITNRHLNRLEAATVRGEFN